MQGDFDYLEFIEHEAFEAVDLFLTRYLWPVEEAIKELKEIAEEGYDVAFRWWRRTHSKILDEHKRQQEAERLAERILVNPEMLRFAPPETKGRILRALCESSLGPFEEKQEKAIITILDWTQSQREYREILEHMTLDGTTIDYQDGHQMLMGILDGLEMYQYFWLQFKLAVSEGFEDRQKSEIRLQAQTNEPVQKRFFA